MLYTPMSKKDASLLNPLQLAYMGDSVWEMIVRRRLIFQRKNVHHMHIECVKKVNASSQARGMNQIQSKITADETAIFLRGRNAHTKHPAPKNQNPADYAESTGFEALLGYLYLTGNFERLKEIENIIFGEETDHA